VRTVKLCHRADGWWVICEQKTAGPYDDPVHAVAYAYRLAGNGAVSLDGVPVNAARMGKRAHDVLSMRKERVLN
jgi:hypothetical protein